MAIQATLRRFTVRDLPRSSHSLSVVGSSLHIFGGEVEPRKPVVATVHSYKLGGASTATVELQPLGDASAQKDSTQAAAPEARVGHAAASIDNDIFIFGGRGGKDMAPLQEDGRVWKYSTEDRDWEALDVADSSSGSATFPEARSYHSATSDGRHRIFVHGGCPRSGRTGDCWSFDIAKRVWEQLPSAPNPPRGGPGFVYGLGKLYRFGGFDGTNELGGQVDFLDVGSATEGHQQQWQTFSGSSSSQPGPRSVTGLQVVEIGGQPHLVAFFGERDASKIGHEGAGSFWDDIWALALRKDGEPTGEDWVRCEVKGEQAPARGWFASGVSGNDIVIYGGLNGDNARESDGYVIQLEIIQ